MITYTQQLEVAEELKKLLLTQIEQGGADENRYTILRRTLLQDRKIQHLIPQFIKSDTTLKEIRRRAQNLEPNEQRQITPYVKRRDWLSKEFELLLDFLQQPQLSSVEEIIAEVISNTDSEHIKYAWDKALERRRVDPEGAITIARSLVESVCKEILGSGNYDKNSDLPVLYKEAARKVGLTEERYADDSLKQMMRGCVQIIHGLAEFRNKMGDAHGKGPTDPKSDTLQSELAITVAGAMATYIMGSWDSKV